jgi:hypothetical protein
VDELVRAAKDAGREGKVVLVVDQLDLLLAAGEGGDGVAVGEMILELREVRRLLFIHDLKRAVCLTRYRKHMLRS